MDVITYVCWYWSLQKLVKGTMVWASSCLFSSSGDRFTNIFRASEAMYVDWIIHGLASQHTR